MVPGFSQPATAWTPVVTELPDAIRTDTVAIDVPDRLDFAATALAVGAAGGDAIYCGYSMGGRLALQLALDDPARVRALILVSASAGIADPAARAERRALDHERAQEIDALGVAEFLRRWLAQPLFATLSPDLAMLDARAAHLDSRQLVHQMTTLGQGAMEPLHERLHELRVATTVVVGRADTRYSALGHGLVENIPGARLAEIDGGHALPLEQPAALAAVLAEVHAATR